MNWRLATLINALIALVTITAVVYDVSRGRDRKESTKPVATDAATTGSRNPLLYSRENALEDITQVRVDQLAIVPPSELYEVLLCATPAQITALALKFNELPSDGPTVGAVGMFFQAWAEIDGKSAIQAAFQIKEVKLRRVATGTVVGSVSPSTCAELVKYLSNHPDPDLATECRGQYLDRLLERWAFVDPPAATKFFDEMGEARKWLANYTAGGMCRAWATVDPEKALAWLDKQTDTEVTRDGAALNDLILGWCTKDRTAAASYMVRHLDRPGAGEALASITSTMFEEDPKQAAHWLGDLPSGKAKDHAESSLAYAWTQKDPLAAARWVEKFSPNDHQMAIGMVATIWAQANWTEASKWLAGLSGDRRDLAISAAVANGNPVTIPPLESLPLALSVTDGDTRREAIRGIIERWAITDRSATETWIKSSGLSKQEKKELLALDIFSPERRELEISSDPPAQ